MRITVWMVLALLLASGSVRPCAADGTRHTLAEPSTDGRVAHVESRVDVKGTAEFAIEKGRSISHPIAAQAVLKYRERRLPGAGRDADALHSLRQYESVEAKIKVADHLTFSRLSSDRRRIVAQGRREGILFYSLDGPLTASDLEVLRAPGESLCLLALLPAKPVTVGEKWSPDTWVGQMLTDTEAAAKSELTCTLESVNGNEARVTFEGKVEGATAAATAAIELHGYYLFHLKENRLTRAEIEQTEKRSIGPVSPGMKVTAKATITRSASTKTDELDEAAASAVPLDPPAELTRLRFRAPWNVEFDYDRNWHVFQQSEQVAVLRLIEKGTFVAQCNLAPLRPAGRGEHVGEKQFEQDVRQSLGKRLKTIEKAEKVDTGDSRYLYRVTAVGESNGVPVTWTYYLCAAPSGTQVSFVFAVESSLRDRVGSRDLEMVKGLKFLDPPTATLKINDK